MSRPAQPEGYEDFLRELKQRIRTAQVRAAVGVNRELILLYWHLGRDIVDRQNRAGWGAKVIKRLAADLHSEFPDVKGFSRTNLLYMRAFAEAWPEESFVQQVVGQIPWGHNLRILDLVKDLRQREWYVRAALQHGWSRNVLIHQIESGLDRRLGRAQTNFGARRVFRTVRSRCTSGKTERSPGIRPIPAARPACLGKTSSDTNW